LAFGAGAGRKIVDGGVLVFVKATSLDFGAIDPDYDAVIGGEVEEEL